MNQNPKFEVDGEVLEILPAGFLRVILRDYGTEIRCKKSGKMSKYKVSVIPGDWVKLELSPYDPTQGRITYRYNQKPPKQEEEINEVQIVEEDEKTGNKIDKSATPNDK